jgi:hypothetical protein
VVGGRAPPPPAALAALRIIDEVGMAPPGLLRKDADQLDYIMEESGVDVRVRIVKSTRGKPLPEFTLAMMRDQRIGDAVGGRGMLIVIDDSSKNARIEVGPHLEGIFPDGFVGYLIRDNLSEMFENASPELALRTTVRIIHARIRNARLGGEWDPRILTYIQDVRRLAAGGGATASIPGSARLQGLLARPDDSALAAYFSPQPTVELAYQRQQEFFALGLWPTYVPLFTRSSKEVMERDMHGSRGWDDYILMIEYGYAYEIDQRDNLAMLVFTGTPFASPLFFRRNELGWQEDIPAEMRNTQEVIGTYYTWHMRINNDWFSQRFTDRYQQFDGVWNGEFLRIRGGDNRAMCIYGEPHTRISRRFHKTMCLADSLQKGSAE